ncbi:hypothetical protein FA13DRAFT_1721852 [Coprinellus micaceus]|uniref:Uncharacterized protein n=1 Tax=Coprinellus micaceus TaxID=71717 RepID=A0A4Y7RVS3_COPMI|nr:hypothetical protein FA13DRAFT_1721852 [Coprinellus micaceus]
MSQGDSVTASVVHQLFCASVRGRQIVLEYPRQIEHLLPELFQAASVSAIAYKSKMIAPDLIADTEVYASTITRFPAEPHIDYGARKMKLLQEHFPFDATAAESTPLMSVDPAGTLGVVHLPGILSSRLRRQVKQGLQVLQDAGITDQHPSGWAYGWGSPIVELTNSGLSGGPPIPLQPVSTSESAAWLRFLTLTRDTFCVIHAIRNIFDPDGAERVMATRARFVTSFRTSPSTLSPSIVDQWGSPFNRLSMFVNRGVSFFETLRLPDRLHTVSSFGSDFQQILTIPGSALRLSFPPGTVTLIKGRIPFQVSQPTQPHAFVIERHPPSASPFEPLWDVGPAEVSAVVHLSAEFRDMPSAKWANFYLYTCTRLGRAVRVYGTQGQAMSPEMRETYLRRLGNELGWSATVGAIADAYNHRVWHQKVVTDVLTVLASDDPSNPEHYSRMKPYKVLDIIFEVKTLAWWDDVTDISVHGFGSLEAAFDAFTHDRVTTIDWEDALTFTERLRVGANKSELMAQAKTIAENLLELIRERIDHVKARMTVLADRLEQQSGGAIHCAREWEDI